jgi:oligopeptide/dipeptide ABC transporter ATP-binding protein
MMNAPILSIEGLGVAFATESGPRAVLRDVGFTIAAGEVVGVVGESGSGKSVTALALMGLLGAEGTITSGRIVFDGQDLARLDGDAMRKIRGRRIGMIFQEPMTSLNPLLSIGFQVAEVLRAHLGLSAAQARTEVVGWFGRVGLPHPERRYDAFPHELSGGMRQRVMIAMAMACRPALLIADEPTTALDVTIQAQILGLMNALRRDYGTSILLITHDMGVIARLSQRVVVMYAGEVVETGTVREVLKAPVHPYTRLLLAAMPSLRRRDAHLPFIPGAMPAPGAFPGGCRFHPRCPDARAACAQAEPALLSHACGRSIRCPVAAGPAAVVR